MAVITPPEPGEYSSYYQSYIDAVRSEDIFELLRQQPETLERLLQNLPDKKADSGYAAGKWSIKELISHIIDTERVFSYRTLRFARKDRTALAGFEQDDFVKASGANKRTLRSLLDEFKYLRMSNVLLYESINKSSWHWTGEANNVEVSVRALIYITAGHVQHHTKILQERYL